MKVVALVVAAGRGSRAAQELPKQYAPLAGVPVLRRTLEAVSSHPKIDALQVVIGVDDAVLYEETIRGLPGLLPPAIGGSTRQQSVLSGLEALAAHDPQVVLVHDAARPFVSPAIIGRVIAACEDGEAAIPAMAISETVKRVEAGTIAATVPRENLMSAQTPQGFPFHRLLDAHREATAAGRDDLTDDAAVAALAGVPVRVVEGERGNTKLTTHEDFAAAEKMLDMRMDSRTARR